MKLCSRCKKEFEVNMFYLDKTRKDGLGYWCKNCSKIKGIKYFREAGKERRKETYFYLHLEKDYKRKYQKSSKYKKYRTKYEKNRYATNIQFKLAVCLRNRLRYAIKKTDKKIGSAVKDLGCTISELKFYLEGKFKEGMTWENHGKWHIDHIVPLSFFDLTDREQFLKAVNYTNLQPLWAEENFIKNNKSYGGVNVVLK